MMKDLRILFKGQQCGVLYKIIMNLEEARAKYLGQTCDINWHNCFERSNLKKKNNFTVPYNTEDVLVTNIFELIAPPGIYFKSSKTFTPFMVDLLIPTTKWFRIKRKIGKYFHARLMSVIKNYEFNF